MASKKLDLAIANRDIQREIAGSKKIHKTYGIIEKNIVEDYAQLVDNKLRMAFLNIPMNDFRTASGFGNPAKANAAVKEYYEVHAHLSFFVKQDINQHKGLPDAQLSAFRRWVSVSSQLLQNGSYEGFQLVFTNLQALATPQLEHGLPLAVRREYNRMCQLNTPNQNTAALRHHIQDQQHAKSFTPLLLRFRDINTFNENIEQTQDKKERFARQVKILNRSICRLTSKLENDKDSESLKTLLAEKQAKLTRCKRIIKRADKAIKTFESAKMVVLVSIANEKSQPVVTLPEHLEKTYNKIRKNYKSEDDSEDIVRAHSTSEPPSPRGHKREKTSTLYSEKILPSFFNRERASPNKHWEDVYQTRPRGVSI
ncbi:hypothetical protein ELY21_05405 [Legionella sp. km535]|uniref:hypothetical protein n=1 Tax=Legionella sp. km535 TaxID=2498107 RepID=UPI000F8EA54F|nr:hypothetical protein [Legionella sp. km535]RUR19315.1 hypothetical protein ELY21_05405 [Legionella sp. km535]